MNKGSENLKTEKGSSRGIISYIIVALVPAVLIALYYLTLGDRGIMEWVSANIAMPYRAGAAAVTSFGPLKYFSLAEVFITLIIVWALYYIIRTAVIVVKKPRRLFNLGRRVLVLAAVALYIGAMFFWLWDSGYRCTDLAQKTGLNAAGVTNEQLAAATRLFAEKANEFSTKVKRDAGGRFSEDRDGFFKQAGSVYLNVVKIFPELRGEYYAPKPMIYSKLMSETGFTGVYIALTGETNINVDAPACLVPATIAHEMAHQRGVTLEEEANFSAVAACVTSDDTVYKYSGYLLGLLYLENALYKADPAACNQITATLNAGVRQDFKDYNDYWNKYKTQTSKAAAAAYDSFLKSNGVKSGISSYGECVDMLALWVDRGID